MTGCSPTDLLDTPPDILAFMLGIMRANERAQKKKAG